ncbi:MAG: mkl [Gammaproteobacteria bacterium]|jgi:phospholipid/cholesterol/gamma-HCH transport system ATP-binding protein|nr:mkl [Gammaproteobacteria bacterium]
MTTPIIEIQRLTIQLGGKTILNHLDLSIQRGEVLAIVGGSGSGKSTLLRAILCLIPIASGTIKFFGKANHHRSETEFTKLCQSWGVLFQQGALFSSLTVLQNIEFPLHEYTDLDAKTITEIALLKLKLVGLNADAAYKFPSELSGGMQKRVALARALALDPALLFLDEPTAGLDPVAANSFDELILNLQQTLGLSIIMVTHDLDTLWHITNRVAFLAEGKVLEVGNMQELAQSEQAAIKNYFNGPRGRAAKEQY